MEKKKRGRPKKVVIQENNEAVTQQPEAPQSAKTGLFSVVLNCNGQEYKSEGATIYEALSALPVDWVKVKTKGTIVITDGVKTVSKFLPLILLRPLVAGKFQKIIWSKNLSMLMK